MADERDRVIGENAKRLRVDRRLSKRELARRAGVHHNTVTNIEEGKGSNTDSLKRIALALEANLDALTAGRVTQVPVGPLIERFKKSKWCEKLEWEHGKKLGTDEEIWLRAAPIFEMLGTTSPTDKAIYLLVLARREEHPGMTP